MNCPVGYTCTMSPTATFPPSEIAPAIAIVLAGIAAVIIAIGVASYLLRRNS